MVSRVKIPAHCLRGGALRICLAMMLGLLVVPGYVVVPILFTHAGSNALAGALAGHIFHVSNYGIMGLAAAVAMFWVWGGHIGRMLWGILLIIAILVGINEFWVAGVIGDLKSTMGSVDMTPADHPLRKRFGMWHGVSSLLHLLSSVLALSLLVSHGSHRGGATCSE